MKETIQKTMKYKVTDFQLVLTLLNVMYGVFLGVFSQYLVQFSDAEHHPIDIKFLVCSENIFFVASLFLYYLLDWFSSNITLLFEKGTNHIILLSAIIFIFWLGFMLIIALNPGNSLFLSFGIYSAIASSLDIELKYKVLQEDEVIELRHSWRKYHFFFIRLLLSLILIFFSVLLIYNANSASQEAMSMICYLAFIGLIIAKLFRYFWLVNLKDIHDRLKPVSNE